jgi:hypothetical protein
MYCINFVLFFILILSFSCNSDEKINKKIFIVILDPAGDAKRTGRNINDSYERGLTLQYAEKIEEYIEAGYPHISVMITRAPGDTIQDLQNASLANRKADFFVHLSMYHCKETKPTLFLYQFSYGNDFAPLTSELTLYPYDEAYRINKNQTDQICHLFKEQLSQQCYQPLWNIEGIYAIPIKPLIGIMVPCIACEIGVKNKDSLSMYVEPMAHSIVKLFD